MTTDLGNMAVGLGLAVLVLLSACVEATSHESGDRPGDGGTLDGGAGAGGTRPGAGGGNGVALAGAGGSLGPDAGGAGAGGDPGAAGSGGPSADGGAHGADAGTVPWCLVPPPASRPPFCADTDQPYSQQLTVTSMCPGTRTVDPFGPLRCAFCADSRGHFLDGCTTGVNVTCYPYVDPVIGGHETCCSNPTFFCVTNCAECAP
jgi:hypothetical protein